MRIPELANCDIYEFKPPKNSSCFIRLMKILYPAFLKLKYGNLKVRVVKDGIQRIKQIPGNRVIICPNHPAHCDPDTMFELSRLMGEDICFLTAREVLRASLVRAFLLQLIGCYSVIRGFPDVQSFKTSRKLLIEGKHKIVIFPEGEISGQDDFLLPIKPGAAHLACSAIDCLREEGLAQPVFILPIALKYDHSIDLSRQLERITNEIEVALGIEPDDEQSLPSRLTVAAEVVLETILGKYNGHGDFSLALGDRANLTRDTILKSIATYTRLPIPPKISQVELAHRLYLHLYELRWYEAKLERQLGFQCHHYRYQILSQMSRDLRFVINFFAIGEDAIRENSGQEKLAHIAEILEKEIFSRQSIRSPIDVSIEVGQPIDVLKMYGENGWRKGPTIAAIDELVRSELTAMLETRRPVKSVA